jgi:hypothetical protein
MSKINGFEFEIDKKVIFETNGISNFTGVTSITKIASVFIPANSFTVNDIVTITFSGEKSGTTSTSNWNLYWNTSDTLASATQISTRSIIAANQYIGGYRRMAIRTSNDNSLISGVAFNQDTDFSIWTQALSTLSLNWTVDSYLLLGGLSSVANPIRSIYLKISN